MKKISLKEIENDLKKCSKCKKCEEVCSIFLFTNKFTPYEKLEVVKEIFQNSLKPDNWETVFLCTKCEACDYICPEKIPLTRIVDEGRKTCVEKWGIQYSRQQVITQNILNTGNPFANKESRTAWLEEDIPKKSKNLLHLGCMISYSNPQMGKSIVSVLKKLGVEFKISPEEFCCGYFVYNTGNHEVANQIIEKNINEFKKFKQIITACAGCYTFLKEHYDLTTQLKHVIEIISEKIQNKSINSSIKRKIAIFLDSCHLTRPHGIIESPRVILEEMGYKLKEFDLTKEKGLCCGADGGMRIINKTFALEMGKKRLEKAIEKSDIIFTLCPFCIHNLKEAAQTFDINIQIKDIFEELNKLL
jgi:Fe-S oxidoreductase